MFLSGHKFIPLIHHLVLFGYRIHLLVYDVNMYKEKFAEKLKELIGQNSVSKVAKEIGIPQQTLSRYILCQREIGLETLCKIADYFEEDLDFMVGRENNRV